MGMQKRAFSTPEPIAPEPITPDSPIGPGTGGFRGRINFGGQDTVEAPSAAQQGPNDRASHFYEMMENARNQPSPGLSAYKEALQNMPTPDQYKPNWLTRIASGLSGFSAGMRDPGRGAEVAMGINRSNYDNAIAEYSNRLGSLKEQATMEEASKRSELDAMHKAYQMGLDYDKFEQTKIKDKATIEQGATTANARATSAQAALRNASKQDYVYTPVQGGFIVQNRNNPDDPITGRIIPAKTVQDAQNEVARFSAQTSRGQLGVAQGQLALDQQLRPRSVAAQEATAGASVYRALNPQDSSADSFIPAGSTTAARKEAETQLLADPTYGPMLGRRGNGYFNTLSAEEQADLEAEIQDVMNEILNRRRGGE